MSLSFAEAVQQKFRFLADSGFACRVAEPGRLEYATANVFLTVEWDRRSGELNVFVGRRPMPGQPRDSFSLTDILRMQNVDVPERNQPYQVADEEKLAPFLEQVANDTAAYAARALAGDAEFYRELEAFRNAQSQADTRMLKLQAIRRQAQKAWEGKDFARLIDLWAAVESQLTEVERKKLAYARAHVAPGPVT